MRCNQVKSASRIRMKFIERKRHAFVEEIGSRVILITQDEGLGFVKAYLQEVEATRNIKKIDVHLFNACKSLQKAGGYLHEKQMKGFLASNFLKSMSTVIEIGQ